MEYVANYESSPVGAKSSIAIFEDHLVAYKWI